MSVSELLLREGCPIAPSTRGYRAPSPLVGCSAVMLSILVHHASARRTGRAAFGALGIS